MNVSLKSGTNACHGSVYEFARRKELDSNEYFFKVNNREKPNHKLDQYGFQIDGPVIRNIATKADQNISEKTRM